MKTALRLLTGALALAIASSGFAGASAASSTTPTIDDSAVGIIQGGGASFPNDQYQKWISDIATYNVGFGSNSGSSLVLTYTKSSSGTGKSNFYGANARKASQMFSGSDSLLTSAQRASAAGIAGGYTVVPMTAGSLSVITNLPGISVNIKLNAEVLCGIYAGDITSWNNAKILALNPTVKALKTYNHTIVPVARDATSGTTFIFVSFLATGATAAQHNCGYTTDWADTATSFSSLTGTISPADAVMSTRFSAMRAAKTPAADAIQSKTGNDGIRNYVSATSYSVGYVEMAYSFARNVKTAAIATASKYTSGKNKGKPNYLLPSVAGATNALEAQNKRYPGAAINPSASYLQPVNQAGLSTYPIVGYSWMLLYRNYDTTITDAPTLGQVQGLVYFLNWSLTTGSVYTAGGVKCYAPLPTSVKKLVIAQLKTITANGVTVWQ